MNSGIFNVLGNCPNHEFAVCATASIQFPLLPFIFRNYYWRVLSNFHSFVQISLQTFLIMHQPTWPRPAAHMKASPRRISTRVANLGIFTSQIDSIQLINFQFITHLREFISIFCTINALRRSSKIFTFASANLFCKLFGICPPVKQSHHPALRS